MYFRGSLSLFLAALVLTGCDSPSPLERDRTFLEGTAEDPQIGLVVHSSAKALTLFQLGNPNTAQQIPFGASRDITPTGISVRGKRALIPLGNAASAALVDLERQRVERFFLFPQGNATGSAFVDDTTALVANLTESYVGRITVGQQGDAITRKSAEILTQPTHIVMAGDRALVISSNYDNVNRQFRRGAVTALNPRTLEVLGRVDVGLNPTSAALGPDNLLYVVNTGNYSAPGSLTIINPQTLAVVAEVEGMGVGPGNIFIDAQGRAFISGFFFGTLVWDTRTRQFIRGADAPLCAPLPDNQCRGAFDAELDAAGNVYQLFFGSARAGLKPQIFKYRAGTFELVDSLATSAGPTAIDIREF